MEKSDPPAGQSKNIDPSQMETPDSGKKPTGPPATNIGPFKSKNVDASQTETSDSGTNETSPEPPALNSKSKIVDPSASHSKSKIVDPSQTETPDSGSNKTSPSPTGSPAMNSGHSMSKNVDPSQTETPYSGSETGQGRLSKISDDLTLQHIVNTDIHNLIPEDDPRFYIVGYNIGGNVYKATTLSKEVVAVKKIQCRNAETEGRIISRVKFQYSNLVHDSILGIRAIFAARGLLWVVSPYLEHSLPELLSASRWAPLNEELIAPILKGTLTGLAYLHSKSIAHGNIRLGNILIDHHGVVKIGDLGILESDWGGDDLLKCDETPYWYPPETLTTKINWAFDIWAVGILALELGLGRPPAMPVHPSGEFVKFASKRFCMDSKFCVEHGMKGKKFSTEFQQFVKRCLCALPDRHEAQALLSSDFLIDCRGPESLREDSMGA